MELQGLILAKDEQEFNEIYEKIKPFCKRISISIVPKDLGNTYHEEEFNKRFGFINHKEITMTTPNLWEDASGSAAGETNKNKRGAIQ